MLVWTYDQEHGWEIESVKFHVCPDCGGPVDRIPRRPIDRFLSLFSRRHRYRCESKDCAWEGNLRPMRPKPPAGPPEAGKNTETSAKPPGDGSTSR